MNSFKNRLDKYWENQEILYNNYRAEINLMQGSHGPSIIEMEEELEPLEEASSETCSRNHPYVFHNRSLMSGHIQSKLSERLT